MTRYINREDYEELGDRLITGLAWDVTPTKLQGQWTVSRAEKIERRSGPRAGLLKRFCKLAASKNDAVGKFAHRYGPLHLCEQHGFPQRHPTLEPCDVRRTPGSTSTSESVEHWRRWASRFAGTVGMAGSLRHQEPIAPQDVHDAFDGLSDWTATGTRLAPPRLVPGVLIDPDGRETPVPAPQWDPPGIGEQLLHLTRWLNFLIAISGVGRRVEKVAGRPQLALLDGFNPECPLFGVLVLELVATCSGVGTVARCRHCGTAFTPTRRTQRYCQKCRKPQVRWRRAQQRRRAGLRARGRTARGTLYKKKGTQKR